MKFKKNYIVFGSPLIGKNEIKEVNSTLKSGWLGTGPKVEKFENEFKKYKGTKYSAAVNSCTAALHLSLLQLKLNKNDEVITPALTFCSTVNAIIHSGAKPVLADVDLNTQNISAMEIEKKITKKTKAIVIVHFAGRPCEMSSILHLVKKHHLYLVEDCAHAIESRYQGKSCGTFGEFGCFSFYSTKNLVTGEGGMIVSNNKKNISQIKILALHGLSKDAWKRFSDKGFKHYDVVNSGFKYNMMDLQAAIGIHQLKSINKNLIKRSKFWNIYNNEFKNLNVETPHPESTENGTIHAKHLYTLQINKKKTGLTRDIFISKLHKRGIGTGVHYRSIPEFSFYKKNYNWSSYNYPNAKKIGEETVSLPLSPKLTLNDIERIVREVRNILC
jgi:dTDP-4-amino-4,6-dideoxygalactose transaminase